MRKVSVSSLIPLFAIYLMQIVFAINNEEKNDLNFIECIKNKRKGDIGDLPFILSDFPIQLTKPLQVRRRRKRFVSFPPGSTLVVRNALSLLEYNDGWKTLRMNIGIPVALRLPQGRLKLIGKHDNPDDLDGEVPYDQQYRSERSLNDHRKSAFLVMENILENLGLPGKLCLQKAVCEVASEPMEFGIFGELLNMLLTPGYGANDEDMDEFIEAEQLGRDGNECENLFSTCPVHLTDFLMGGMTFFQKGLSTYLAG